MGGIFLPSNLNVIIGITSYYCVILKMVLHSLHGLPRNAVSWNRQDRNRQSMQRMQNTWSVGTGLCLNARTQM